jgi:hypothetical protein
MGNEAQGFSGFRDGTVAGGCPASGRELRALRATVYEEVVGSVTDPEVRQIETKSFHVFERVLNVSDFQELLRIADAKTVSI